MDSRALRGVKKENPRHISKQLRAIEQFLDSENPDKSLVAQVMKECCQKYRYQFSQFKVVYSLAKAGRELTSDDCRAQVPSGNVSYTDLSVYAKAFQERTERKEAAARSVNREILKSMDTGHIPVQRLTALLENVYLKSTRRVCFRIFWKPQIFRTPPAGNSFWLFSRPKLKGRNERRRKRNYSAAHFPPKYPTTGRV